MCRKTPRKTSSGAAIRASIGHALLATT
jgi:hypothetical protein